MQLELLARPVTPLIPRAGLPEPRLWVRKLVIWRRPHEPLREVELRPGLNIVWSPDAGARGASMGHGGGKTTFCRLLRYCLGEDSFAPDGQRRSTRDKLPDGHVSAELRLDGEDWVVVRALGPQSRDVVLRGGTVAEAFNPSTAATGMEPLRDAVTSKVIGDAAALMPAAIGPDWLWQAVLAWLTRDQECRFDKLLHWRDPDSKSGSPVRNISETQRLDIVRALLGALTPSELEARREERANVDLAAESRAAVSGLEWAIARSSAALSRDLGRSDQGVGGEFDVVVLKSIADDRLAAAQRTSGGAPDDLPRLRAERAAARAWADQLNDQASDARVAVEKGRTALAQLRGEASELGFRRLSEQNPVCPLCKLPVSKVLAEGCGIVIGSCDLGVLQAEINQVQRNISETSAQIGWREQRAKQLAAEVVAARQQLRTLEDQVSARETALAARTKSIRSAERAVEDVGQLQAMLIERDDHAAAAAGSDRLVAEARNILAEHREQVSEIVRRLTERFDQSTRALISEEVSAEAKLDGNGLILKLQMGGDRVTAAIESLKIVAFDIAVLALTIEGHTRLPGFLVHDSPREADLGLSIYHRLFPLIIEMEQASATPLFQYVVTTTTAPPDDLQKEPWLRLELHGAPATERLFGMDF